MKNELGCPCGVIHLRRDVLDKSIYYVHEKEGDNIPDLLGKLSNDREFLIHGCDFESDENGLTYSLYTTNQNAEGRYVEKVYRGEELLQIAKFQLTPEHKGVVRYKDYAMTLQFSANHDRLSIRFYERLGNYVPYLPQIWEQGYLEDRVV